MDKSLWANVQVLRRRKGVRREGERGEIERKKNCGATLLALRPRQELFAVQFQAYDEHLVLSY
jgi:hypothetical protein